MLICLIEWKYSLSTLCSRAPARVRQSPNKVGTPIALYEVRENAQRKSRSGPPEKKSGCRQLQAHHGRRPALGVEAAEPCPLTFFRVESPRRALCAPRGFGAARFPAGSVIRPERFLVPAPAAGCIPFPLRCLRPVSLQSLYLGGRQCPPFSRPEPRQPQPADPGTDQPLHLVADLVKHEANLPLQALAQYDPQKHR